jgi:hypothetical protein
MIPEAHFEVFLVTLTKNEELLPNRFVVNG